MKTLERIGSGRKKVVGSYLFKIEPIKTKYGELKEIFVFQIKRKNDYLLELEFLIDNGERYIRHRFYLKEKMYAIIENLKKDVLGVLKEFSVI
jgi:hypothetical protein